MPQLTHKHTMLSNTHVSQQKKGQMLAAGFFYMFVKHCDLTEHLLVLFNKRKSMNSWEYEMLYFWINLFVNT